MSWFFADPTTFQNGNSETVTNNPINLKLLDAAPVATTATPFGTGLSLFAIRLTFSIAIADKYLYYTDETARDTDLALLEAQLATPSTIRAGFHTATPTSFTNSNSETIANTKINLDEVVIYEKTTSKPFSTSEILPAIKMIFASSVQYLYYPDTITRDADYTVIQNTVSAINTSYSLLYTPSNTDISGSNAGAWVTRNLAVGANKVVQVRVNKIVLNGDAYSIGVRAVGSTESQISIGNCAFYRSVMTDDNGDIEIYSNNLNVEFCQTDIITIV